MLCCAMHCVQVFLQSSDVNLLSSVLDTPDWFWDVPDSLQVGGWVRMGCRGRGARMGAGAEGHAWVQGQRGTHGLHACLWLLGATSHQVDASSAAVTAALAQHHHLRHHHHHQQQQRQPWQGISISSSSDSRFYT